MTEHGVLGNYYAARAAEYDAIYRKPERQLDLAQMRRIVAEFARGRRVLEVACGTGYWTQVIADTAEGALASDIGEEVLALARARLQHRAVRFQQGDAFDLEFVAGLFDAAFAGFWWSHVPVDRLPSFLARLHRCLQSGAHVFFLDNRYVEGNSTAIARTDRDGNTYQRRSLSNGASYEILKNFPTHGEIERHLVTANAKAIEIVQLEYYWYARYQVGGGTP
jgi:ubiquinone/menaquinone biosynthesis C-methylase UbiE